jgi:hypothetical protein
MRGQRLVGLDPSGPSRWFLKLIDRLPRALTSTIIQIRTGHIPLNAYLHRIGKINNAACDACGYRRETPLHFLTQCPNYEEFRRPLKRLLHKRTLDMRSLFTSRKSLQLLTKFIADTRRFEQRPTSDPQR